MSEQEPSFEEQIAALKLSLENIEQTTDPAGILNQGKDLVSSASDTGNLVNDFMTQRRELLYLWSKAETEDRKREIKNRIKTGINRLIEALEKRPKT